MYSQWYGPVEWCVSISTSTATPCRLNNHNLWLNYAAGYSNVLCKIDTRNLQLFKTPALLLRINYIQWMRLVVYHPEFEECNQLVSFTLLRAHCTIVLRHSNLLHTKNYEYPTFDIKLFFVFYCLLSLKRWSIFGWYYCCCREHNVEKSHRKSPTWKTNWLNISKVLVSVAKNHA